MPKHQLRLIPVLPLEKINLKLLLNCLRNRLRYTNGFTPITWLYAESIEEGSIYAVNLEDFSPVEEEEYKMIMSKKKDDTLKIFHPFLIFSTV